MFSALKHLKARKGRDLSSGEQQQLAMARAFISQPKELIFDEPSEGVQPNIITQIAQVIAQLKGRGDMAIILVEQYFDFAFQLADQF